MIFKRCLFVLPVPASGTRQPFVMLSVPLSDRPMIAVFRADDQIRPGTSASGRGTGTFLTSCFLFRGLEAGRRFCHKARCKSGPADHGTLNRIRDRRLHPSLSPEQCKRLIIPMCTEPLIGAHTACIPQSVYQHRLLRCGLLHDCAVPYSLAPERKPYMSARR